jgi:hypothetical protein
MSSREITFLIGFLILGIAPVFAGNLTASATEIIMIVGMLISTAAAFFKSA